MKNLVPNRPPKKWLIVRALLLKIHEQVLNGTKPENSAPKTATATVRQWPLLWPVHARGSSSHAIEPTKVAQQRCPQSRWPPPQRIHTTSDRFELPKKKRVWGWFFVLIGQGKNQWLANTQSFQEWALKFSRCESTQCTHPTLPTSIPLRLVRETIPGPTGPSSD